MPIQYHFNDVYLVVSFNSLLETPSLLDLKFLRFSPQMVFHIGPPVTCLSFPTSFTHMSFSPPTHPFSLFLPSLPFSLRLSLANTPRQTQSGHCIADFLITRFLYTKEKF